MQELLNGCICCNLVGQLSDALLTLRKGVSPAPSDAADGEGKGEEKARVPDRIIIETSGSAFPATLCLEVNRVARETGAFTLDGVISVIDVENWGGYEDTSITSKMQAKYTDLVVLNKWEEAGERRLDEVLDRLGDLEDEVPRVKSVKGWIGKEVVLGVDGGLARSLGAEVVDAEHDRGHEHGERGHQGEVEVLSVTLRGSGEAAQSMDVAKLDKLLTQAQKDEVYRIKAILYISSTPKSSGDESANGSATVHIKPQKYILNWAFGRWNYTHVGTAEDDIEREPALRMTIVTALYESTKWTKRIESGGFIALAGHGSDGAELEIKRIS